MRVRSKALFDRDIGAFRASCSKTPVGFEGNTSTPANTFIEQALPTQAGFENRRAGVDWALYRPAWLAQAGHYNGSDLEGANDGHTLAGRVAWVPRNHRSDGLHFGVSASREARKATANTLGMLQVPSAKFGSAPEAGLSPLKLVGSGTLKNVAGIDRTGPEGLWIHGPWSLQGEYLRANTSFDDGKPAYRIDGWYAFASWIATGESRPYKEGNVIPSRPWGALEFLLRYSTLVPDDDAIQGGREHDWTPGANWYLGQHLKLPANDVRAFSDRKGLVVNPRIVELRAQIAF